MATPFVQALRTIEAQHKYVLVLVMCGVVGAYHGAHIWSTICSLVGLRSCAEHAELTCFYLFESWPFLAHHLWTPKPLQWIGLSIYSRSCPCFRVRGLVLSSPVTYGTAVSFVEPAHIQAWYLFCRTIIIISKQRHGAAAEVLVLLLINVISWVSKLS